MTKTKQWWKQEPNQNDGSRRGNNWVLCLCCHNPYWTSLWSCHLLSLSSFLQASQQILNLFNKIKITCVVFKSITTLHLTSGFLFSSLSEVLHTTQAPYHLSQLTVKSPQWCRCILFPPLLAVSSSSGSFFHASCEEQTRLLLEKYFVEKFSF